MTIAFVGIGANLGDRVEAVRRAVHALNGLEGVRVLAVSAIYETAPWGVEYQRAFANAVARVDASIGARPLLAAMQEVERDLGRTPGERYGPRVIDLDLLLYGDEEWEAPDLRVPHPLMLQRDFVMAPLWDVADGAVLPGGEEIPFEGRHVGEVLGVLAPPPWPPEAWTVEPDVDPEPGEVGSLDALAAEPAGLPAEIEPPLRTLEADESCTIDEWIAVGPPRHEWGAANSGAADITLLWLETVLTEAGVPVRFYPHRPNESMLMQWGLPEVVRLFVQRDRVDDARRALEDAVCPPEGGD